MQISLDRPIASTLKTLLEHQAVFYPGSGDDLHAIDIFGSTGEASVFISADYGVSPDYGAGRGRAGFAPIKQYDLNFKELCDVLDADQHHPFGNQWTQFADWETVRGGTSRWVVFENALEHDQEPRQLVLLHVFGDAIWAYWHIWAKRKAAPFAIMIQDHGMGANWTQFGGDNNPLYQIAEEAALPEFLVCGENTAAWPGYARIKPVGQGGMHNHARTRFGRNGSTR